MKFGSNFNKDVTGIRLLNPQKNNKTVNSGYVADSICQNQSMEMEKDFKYASSESRYDKEFMGIEGMFLALCIASAAAAGVLFLFDFTLISVVIVLLLAAIFGVLFIVLISVGVHKRNKWELREDKIEEEINNFEKYIDGVKGPLQKETNLTNNMTVNKVNSFNTTTIGGFV